MYTLVPRRPSLTRFDPLRHCWTFSAISTLTPPPTLRTGHSTLQLLAHHDVILHTLLDTIMCTSRDHRQIGRQAAYEPSPARVWRMTAMSGSSMPSPSLPKPPPVHPMRLSSWWPRLSPAMAAAPAPTMAPSLPAAAFFRISDRLSRLTCLLRFGTLPSRSGKGGGASESKNSESARASATRVYLPLVSMT
eukprot:Mycagemm_TRINITY_DN10280_c0_g2::TRINITY_DN10280_c0_g2_i1::g.3756::m.3756 type:complete len:191 gc:universal TRINITY_DN10280_c0_g2_i1:1358-786(-)